MDLQTYEQIHVPKETMGSASDYLTEGGTAQIATHDGVPISVDLPASIVLTITKHRSGGQGRHAHGCAEAGDARDGGGGERAAVRGGG